MFLNSCIWVRDNEALVEGGLLGLFPAVRAILSGVSELRT